MGVRYFVVVDSEGVAIQGVRFVEFDDNGKEYEEMVAEYEAKGFSLEEVESNFFYYILAEAGVKSKTMATVSEIAEIAEREAKE